MTNSKYFRKAETKCAHCGSLIFLKPSHVKERNYCSHACMAQSYKHVLKGVNNPNYKGVIKRCSCCGEEYKSYCKTSKYCSVKCYRSSKITTTDATSSGSLWKKNNKPKVVSYKQKRRSKANDLPSDFTPIDWEQCLNYWEHRCAYCGCLEGLFVYNKIHQDHFIPNSDKSPNNPGYTKRNIIPACCSCNTSKGNTNPHKWIVERFGKRLGKQIIHNIKAYFEHTNGGVYIVRTVEDAMGVIGL